MKIYNLFTWFSHSKYNICLVLNIRLISGPKKSDHPDHTILPDLILTNLKMVNCYRGVLIRMMSFLGEVQYEADKQFTLAELGRLNPDRLMEWFNFMTFGVVNPPNGHDMPPLLRHSTIMYRKKAISSFMPNRLMVWNEISLVGNPTRSAKLNDLLNT